MGLLDGLLVISNGLRAKRYADKVVAEKSNIDFILMGEAERGEIAFVDAKSFCGARFGRSQLNPRQIALCEQYAQRGFVAGFVVFLKQANHVGFYPSSLLRQNKQRCGFGVEDGVALGSLQRFCLRNVWKRGLSPQR